MTRRQVSFLANNGDVGGGEVMLLAMASAARDAGYQVTVVAPASPSGCADLAQAEGFEVVRISGAKRPSYMRHLRAWSRGRAELLWCNGLVPSVATALLSARRLVHLHRLPEGGQRLLSRLARVGAIAVVVPSSFMSTKLGFGHVMHNWSPPTGAVDLRRRIDPDAPAVVGFLGRLSPDKGVGELAEAVTILNTSRPDRSVGLLLAGEPRFVSQSDHELLERALAKCEPWLIRGGWMERDEFFSRIDVLAVPSTWEEPFGLVVTEAMAAGVPVVVSGAGALPEVVGETYPFVAERGDSTDLARVIDAMLNEPDGLVALTEAARSRWLEQFSPEAGAARFVSMLDRLDDKNGRAR